MPPLKPKRTVASWRQAVADRKRRGRELQLREPDCGSCAGTSGTCRIERMRGMRRVGKLISWVVRRGSSWLD